MSASPARRPSHSAAVVVPAAVLLGLVLTLARAGLAPPDPEPAEAPPEVFSAQRAVTVLERLLGGPQPHPVGSAANRALRDRLVAELERLGLDASVQETWSCAPRYGACAPVANVVATVPGLEDLEAVVLLAHSDSVWAGPGAADDGSGVAVLLETARALLAVEPLRRPVRLVITDGEEAGLLGAEAFVRDHPLAARSFAVVNVEARGTTGPSLMFETSERNAALVAAYARAARRPVASSLFVEVYRRLPNNTDLTVTLEAGLPGLNLAFSDGVARYHTPLDDLAHLDRASVQHQGENTLGLARELAAAATLEAPGDAAYTDLFGRWLLRWPAGLSLLLAVVALAGTLAAGLAAPGPASRRILRLLVGLGAWLLAAVLALALALAVSRGAVAVTGDLEPWRAHPLPLRTSLWAAVLVGALAAAAVVRRLAGPWGLVTGAWLGWSLVAAALALTAPGVAAVVVPPALAAAAVLGATGVLFRRRPGPAEAAAATGTALAGAVFGLPLARLGEIGLGFSSAGTVLIVVSLLLPASSIAPLLAASTLRRASLIGLPVVALAAWAVALAVPLASPDAPRHLNLVHLERADTGEAVWVARPGWGPRAQLPPAVAAAAPFMVPTASPLPWWGDPTRMRTAPATAVGLEEPRVEITAVSREDGGSTRLRGRAQSGRLPNLIVALPESAGVRAIRVQGLEAGPGRPGGGFRRVELYGLPPEGVDLELELGSRDAVEAVLVAWGPGLPAAAAEVARSRPAEVTPVGSGDLTAVSSRTVIGG